MRAMLRAQPNRGWSYLGVGGLVLLAWLALAVWSLSPYAEWLDHGKIQHIAAPLVLRLAVFTLGWTLMIVAMMLPGTVLDLARSGQAAPFTLGRVAPVILTYLAVWGVFGILGYLGDSVLHETVEHTPGLADLVAPGILFAAGIYQLTPLKRAILTTCRVDGTVLRASARTGRHTPWIEGLRHAACCVGACWALMLLMFALGGVSLIGMLALGLVSAAERLSERGADLARLVGMFLILWAGILLLT